MDNLSGPVLLSISRLHFRSLFHLEFAGDSEEESIAARKKRIFRCMPRLHLRAPMSEVRKIFEHMLVPIVSIQKALGCGFEEVEALLRDGPKEEHRFRGWAGLEAAADLGLDFGIRRVEIV